MYTRLHSHGSEQGLWVVAGKKIMNLWLNWPIKTMRRPIMNTLNQLFCSFQNCENWLSVEMIICIILQGGIFIGAESDNVEWDPENNCEKREIEKENTNVDDQASDVITCDGNGDLILRRRPKRQRYSQSKISFFPVSLSHTSTPSKTQYSWFPCYDHIVFCLYEQLLVSLLNGSLKYWLSKSFWANVMLISHMKSIFTINLQCQPFIEGDDSLKETLLSI